MSNVKLFLESRRVKKGSPYTHATMISPKAIYYIEDDESEQNKFWITYCNAVYKNEIVGLTEVPTKYGPLRIDFDFKFKLDEGLKRKYTITHIEDIIHLYQNVIGNATEPSAYDDKLLHCVVLEKRAPRSESGYVKDGFHLHFPNFICDEYFQNVYLRTKIMELLENEKSMEDFRTNIIRKIVDTTSDKLTLQQQIEKVVDPVAKKNWLMYGSRKSEELEPFMVTHCYDESLEKITLNVLFCEQLEYFNSMCNKPHSARYFLPRFLSIHGHDEGTPLGESIKEKAIIHQSNIRERKRVNVKQERSMEEAYADLKQIEEGKVMDMLSTRRADDYTEWMNVGWTLFNIGQGCDKALNMWIEFSSKSEKFVEGECEKQWEKMEMRGKTIASLLFMAKEDNPDLYNEWTNEQIDFLLDSATNTEKPTHYSIAKVMHKMYEHKFICASSQHDLWFEFYNHRWHKVDNGISMIKRMPTEVADEFLKYVTKLQKRIQDSEWDKEKWEKKRNRAYRILTELGQHPFCQQVLKMCKNLFYDSNFLKKMDENRDLIGFENGVYDLKNGVFRNGSPDDYITMSTGRNYHTYSYQDEEILDLMEYLTKVFVNPKLRNYFLDFTASCFQGGNRSKTFAVFTGDGDGGKSIVLKLLEIAYGEYCLNFPRETFIVGRGSSAGGARPDLARVRGKRLAFVKEIAKNENLHIGMIKEMTGNDSFYARQLYEKGSDINPMFTLVLMCNEPPKIPAHDEPTWNRIRVLPFESCFPKDNDPNRPIPVEFEEQMKAKVFPRDPHLMDKIHEFAAPLTWVLLQRFKTYYKEGIYEPDEVKMSTEQYKVVNDIYMQFVNDKIQKIDNKKKYISATEVYTEFKSWYLENHPSYAKEKIGKNAFISELSKRLHTKVEKSRWYGFELITDVTESELEAPSAIEDEVSSFEL